MVWRGRDRLGRLPVRRLDCRGQKIVHETALQNVSAFVVLDLFVKRWSKSHGEPTMNLPFDDHRVDDVAAVVNRNEATHLDLARALVDVDNADVTAERIRKIWRIVVVDCFETRFHSRRVVRVSSKRDLLNRLRAIGRTLDEEFSSLPFEIVFMRFE